MTQSVRYAWKSLRWGYPWLDWSVCVDFINLAYLPGLLTIPVDVRFISMMDLGSRIGSTMPPPPDRRCNLTLPRTPLLLIVGNSFGHFSRSWFVYKAVNILGLVTPLISDAIHWRYRWFCQSWAFWGGFVSGLYGWEERD